MTIVANAIQNGALGPKDFAEMVSRFTPPFCVDDKDALKPTITGNQVRVASGGCVIGGMRVKLTSSEYINVPTSGSDRWCVILRINWDDPNNPVKLITLDHSGLPKRPGGTSTSSFNWTPGRIFDAMVAIVKGKTNREIIDCRVWGGNGGAYFVDDSVWNDMNSVWFNIEPGVRLCRQSEPEQVKWLNPIKNSWELLGGGNLKWQSFEPKLMTSGDELSDILTMDGNRFDRYVTLGSGAKTSGRFKVENGILRAYAHIYTGKNPQFGPGFIGIELPIRMASWITEVNCSGAVSINDKAIPGVIRGTPTEVPAYARIFPGGRFGIIFTERKPGQGFYYGHRTHRDSNPSYETGIPEPNRQKDGSYNEPFGVYYKFVLEYPVDL